VGTPARVRARVDPGLHAFPPLRKTCLGERRLAGTWPGLGQRAKWQTGGVDDFGSVLGIAVLALLVILVVAAVLGFRQLRRFLRGQY
jgi:hypothetical protein